MFRKIKFKTACRLLKSIISCINCRHIYGVQDQSKNFAKQFFRATRYPISTEIKNAQLNMSVGSYH